MLKENVLIGREKNKKCENATVFGVVLLHYACMECPFVSKTSQKRRENSCEIPGAYDGQWNLCNFKQEIMKVTNNLENSTSVNGKRS